MPKKEEDTSYKEDDELVTRRESDIRWENHQLIHNELKSNLNIAREASSKALDAALADHHREHIVHENSHEREHQFTKDALDKSDTSLENRLEGMNEFRAQLERQAANFVTREVFEAYTKEQQEKAALALSNSNDKYDTIIKAIVNRQDQDNDTLNTSIQNLKEGLQKEIQGEREIRKTFEGSVNTWKWLATFLGAGGVAGVILLFAQQH